MFTKLSASVIVAVCLVGLWQFEAHAELRESLLKQLAISNGLVPTPSEVPITPLSAVGEKLFESTLLSLNGDTSCSTCHLDRFGSADGLPIAIGVGGAGEGQARLASGGAFVPRNTLPLWGRGEPDFKLFFWDGKVDGRSGSVISQFLDAPPSEDPLVVAVHLPFVEIREMVVDDPTVETTLKHETVDSAGLIYHELTERVRRNSLGSELAAAQDINVDRIEFTHIARSVAEFIRTKFQRRETPLQKFVFGDGALTKSQIQGGLIFYGKGRCSLCHSGPHFSDFDFHSIPTPQAGSGKNGFGVDYGRYNVTYDPADLYLFRTPPLANVSETAPYSHSGAIGDLNSMIVAHFDPLRNVDPSAMGVVPRIEFYKRLGVSSSDPALVSILSDAEVQSLVEFLMALSF